MKHIDLREKMPGSFEFYSTGDKHIGNSTMNADALKRTIQTIKSKKNAFWADGGDLFEAIAVDDPRFNIEVHRGMDSRMNFQIDSYVEAHEPIKDKCLWILMGNHELTLMKKTDMIHETARRMGLIDKEWGKVNGVQTKTYSTYTVKALFPTFRLLDWHGSGYTQSNARDAKTREVNDGFSIMKKLSRLPGDDCEILIMHHIHKVRLHAPDQSMTMITKPKEMKLYEDYKQPSRIYIDKEKDLYRIPDDERFFCSSGSILRTYLEGSTTYGEIAGYRPTESGFIKVTVKNDKLISVEKYKP